MLTTKGEETVQATYVNFSCVSMTSGLSYLFVGVDMNRQIRITGFLHMKN